MNGIDIGWHQQSRHALLTKALGKGWADGERVTLGHNKLL